MKYILFVFLFFQFKLFSQSTLTEEYEDYGLKVIVTANATQFAKQFLSLSNTSFDVSPYLLGFRVGIDENWIRLNFGIEYSDKKSTSLNNGNNSILINDLNFRIGYQREIFVNKRFSAFVGPDFGYRYFQNKTETDGFGNRQITDSKLSGLLVNLGLGLQWNISNKIGIYTESYFSSQFLKGESLNVFGFNESITSISENSFNYVPPTSLFFHLKF